MVRAETIVILTVFNRDPVMLQRTFEGLALAAVGLSVGAVVVDDGSDDEHRAAYAESRKFLSECIPVEWIETSTIEARPWTYHIGGHNNPAYANNIAIARARELGPDRLLMLSSDTIIERDALRVALGYGLDSIVCGRTVDEDSGEVYCSSEHPWPWCWFVLADARAYADVPFDEEYLRGMGFEDIDFMARLFLRVGKIVIDDRIRCTHQSHFRTAYSDGRKGERRSRIYTHGKWVGGIPFHGDPKVFSWKQRKEVDRMTFVDPVWWNAP